MLLHEKLRSYRVILASGSPRRQQLLREAGIDYELAAKYAVEEVFPASLSAEDVPAYLSELKSAAYPNALNANEILITADTGVCLGGELIGKPADRADALAILGRLSGQKHTVVTGVTLHTADRRKTFSVRTDVWFRELTPSETAHYVDTYKPFDKAGAYGVQEWIGCVGIERIDGSFYNVMGLPVQRLYRELLSW